MNDTWNNIPVEQAEQLLLDLIVEYYCHIDYHYDTFRFSVKLQKSFVLFDKYNHKIVLNLILGCFHFLSERTYTVYEKILMP